VSYGSKYKLRWIDPYGDTVEVYIKEKGYSGDGTITSWSNRSFDTFTSSGTSITSAIEAAGAGLAFSNTFPVTSGETYFIYVPDVVINSGEYPYIGFTLYNGGAWAGGITSSNQVTLSAGDNYVELTATDTDTVGICYKVDDASDSSCGSVYMGMAYVNASGNPAVITWDTPSDDPHEPINGSFCMLNLMSETDGQFSELYTSDRLKYKIEVLINDANYWHGFILPDHYQEPYECSPYPIEIVATDQLGYIKNVEWNHSDNTTIWLALTRCLEETGLNLNIREAVNIYEDAHDQAASDSPLNQTWIKTSVYDEFSHYDVLADCLRKFGAVLKQKDAEWHILVVDDMSGKFNLRYWTRSQADLYVYDSVAEYNPIVSTTKATDDPHVRIGQPSSMFINPAWRKYNLIQNYGALTETFVDNYDFTTWTTSTAPTHWDNTGSLSVTRNGDSAHVAYITSADYTKYISQSFDLTQDSDQRIKFYLKYVAGGITAGTLYVKLALIITEGGTDYYYNVSTGAWGAAPAYYSKGFGIAQIFEEEIITSSIDPSSGSSTLEVRLYAPVNASSNGFVTWDEVKMSLVDEEGSGYVDYDTETETAITVREDNNYDPDDITLYTSDGSDVSNTSLIFDGALWTDSGLDTAAISWRGSRGGGTLADILQYSRKRQHFYPAQTLNLTLYTPYDSFTVIDTIKEIKNGHRLFMPKRVDYDLKNAQWNIEAIELSNDMIRTVVKTIGHPGETGTDYTFDGDANSTAQNEEIVDVVPANARVIDAILVTTEAWDDGIDMALGTASAGTQYFAATAMETLGDLGQQSTGSVFIANISGSASSLWIQGNPDNNWEDITTGETSLIVTYIDNDPVK